MRVAVKAVGVVAVATVAAALVMPASSLTAASGEAVIQERRDLMKEVVLKNWKPIKAYAKNGAGSPAAVAKHAEALAAAAKKIPALFPKGTGRGDYPDKVTRALPAIWNDWKNFEKVTKVFEEESLKLAKVAKGGNKDAIDRQIGLTGKLGCGGCHKPFRGAKAKN